MKKRIISFCLALAMVIGMLPVTVFTARAEEMTANHFAAYATDVTVDGSLNETAWLTYGKMTSEDGTATKDFGALWDKSNLYLAGTGNADGLTVTVDGTAVTAAAVTGTSAWELAVPLTAAWTGRSVPVELTLGDCQWKGTVSLSGETRTAITSWSGGDVSGNNNVSAENTNGILTFKQTYNEGGTNDTVAAGTGFRSYMANTSIAAMANTNGIGIIEYDFHVEKMPEYTSTVSGTGFWQAHGFILAANYDNTNSHGYVSGITNMAGKGLVFTMRQSTTTTTYQLPLNKSVGDTFHIRQEFDFSKKTLAVYCDGQYVGTIENCQNSNGYSTTGAKQIIFNLWQNANLTLTDSTTDIEFSVSNIAVGSLEYPSVRAVYNGGSATWSSTDVISAQWDNTNLYLAVEPSDTTQNLTVAVGEKVLSFNASSTNVAVSDNHWNITIPLADLGIALTDYNTNVTMALSGAYSWTGNVCFISETEDAVTLTNGTIGTDKVTGIGTTVTNDSWQNGNSARFALTYSDEYTQDGTLDRVYILKSGISSMDSSNDELLNDIHVVEFDFEAAAMPEANYLTYDQSLNFVGHGFALGAQWAANNSGGYGYIVGIINLPDHEGLSFAVRTANKDLNDGIQIFDLGKGLNETFHIRLEYSPVNDTLAVWCDGLLLGTVSAENGGVHSVTWSSSGSKLLFLNMYNGTTERTGTSMDFTVSNLTSGTWDDDSYTMTESDLDCLTFDAIKGDNESADKVVSDLALPEKLPHPIFNGYTLTWTTSNADYVTADGIVTAPEDYATATLTATVDGTSLSKNFTLSASSGSMDAVAIAKTVPVETMSIDGVLSEVSWSEPNALPVVTGTGVGGTAYAVWGMGKLYLAAEYTGATQMIVKLGEKSWTLDLTEGDIASGDGLVTGKAADGVVELAIDMLASGIELTDYNQTADFNLTLTDGTNSAAVTGEESLSLVFTGKEPARFGLTGMINVSNNTVEGNEGSNKIHITSTDTNRRYRMLGTNKINHSYDLYFEQTLTIASMTADGTLGGGSNASGYCFWISDAKANPDTTSTATYGTITLACLWNNDGELTLRVNSATTGRTDYPLGVSLGETFTLGYLWGADDTVKIYVDGVLVGTKEQASYDVAGMGNDLFMLNTACVVDITIEDVIYTTVANTAAPTNTLNGLMANIDTGNVTEDLPSIYVNGHFAYNVDWNSSNTAVIADDGSVTRPDTESVTVTLNPVVAGTELGSVEVTVAAYGRTYDILDQAITWDTIANGNMSADAVVGDLSLPQTITVGGREISVSWKSSNTEAVSVSGAVVRGTSTGVATLQVSFTDTPSIVKEFLIKVVGTSSNAYFTTEVIALDGSLDEEAWTYANWKPFTSGTAAAQAAALIHEGVAYIAVKYGSSTSVTVTLGNKTWTVDCATAAVTGVDEGVSAASDTANKTLEIQVDLKTLGMQLKDYGTELAYQLSLSDGTKLEENTAKLTIPALQILTEGAPVNMPGALTRATTIDGNSLSINAVNATDNQSTTYMIHRAFNEADFAYDMLLEQTITINSIAVSNESGLFEGNYVGNGYMTLIHDTDNELFATLVYADSSGDLYLSARKVGGTSDPVELGVKVKDTFTLGLRFSTDGVIGVYVNGNHKGDIANSKIAANVYGAYKTLLIKYMDAGCTGDVTASIDVTDIKLSVMNESYPLVAIPAIETELTQENVLAGLDITSLKNDSVIPATAHSDYLGELDITWTSSEDSVITVENGKVTAIHQAENDDRNVTLTASYNGTELWSVDVTVKSLNKFYQSILAQNTITVDGKLNEVEWADWTAFTGTIRGGMASVWSKGNVYFAVNSNAEKLVLTIGGTEVTVDLTNGTTDFEEATIVKNGTLVEIGIPLAALNVVLTDYNQSVGFSAKLVSGDTEVSLEENYIRFSGIVANVEAMGGYTKSGMTTASSSTGFYGEENGAVNYAYENGNAIDHSVPFVISQDMLFNELPVTDGRYISGLQANGYYGWIADSETLTSGTAGTVVFHSIYRPDAATNELILRMRTATGYVDFSLGEKLGVKFRLSYVWNIDDSVEVYVDGEYLGTVENASYYASGCGADVITYRYYAAASTNTVDFTVSDVTLIKMTYESVLDELTTGAIFGRIDLDHVREDLPMPNSFDSANFAALQLRWESTDTSVVEEDGTIHRDATEAGTTTITVYFVDSEGNETKLWSVDVTVDPMSVTDDPAPAIINTAFTAAAVDMDGTIADEGWTMNGWVLDAYSQICGEFGAQWDQTNLYLAVDAGKAKTVYMTLGQKSIVIDLTNNTVEGVEAEIAVNGSTAEIKIPVSQVFGVEKITEYDKELPITVKIDGNSYTGTLKLTSIDWWLTENAEHAMPVVESQIKSVAYKGGSPDGNQGAYRTENGWRLYDLYNENGENPAGVRTYVLFMKQDIYENFDDRRQAVHVEFDFKAASLPVWNPEECIDFAAAFACYGFTFSLSDKADGNKYSNVAVGGIMNTEDGLVLAVKRTDTIIIPLNKQVGEQFRIGMSWQTNGDMVITIDGEYFETIDQMSSWVGSVGDTSFVMNMIRNNVKPASEADNMEVYISNLAFGKGYSTENILDRLTVDQILGDNDGEYNIITDLDLPSDMTNGQLDVMYDITWTSSNQAVITDEGVVTRPETGGVLVTMTATLSNGETKEFQVIVVGEDVGNDNTLIITGDTDPGSRSGSESNSVLFTLDAKNNSVIRDQGEAVAFNMVTLTDIDEISRLNRESLTLWISDDNVTYTEVRNFKLLHDGTKWYLYDIKADDGAEVSARYVKVHYNHFDEEDSDFTAVLAEMIRVSWETSLEEPSNPATVTVTNTTSTAWQDEAVSITLPVGITSNGLRVALNGEILYHYVEENGTVVVRITDLAAGATAKLNLWNAENAINLENKESVYEVSYGTRESYRNNGGRWVMTLDEGMKFPDGSTQEREAILSMNGRGVRISYDGGYTWEDYASFAFEDPKYDGNGDWIVDEGEVTLNLNGCGGFIFDSHTGRIMYETHILGNPYFISGDKSKSDCRTAIIGSDDGGKNWRVMDILEQYYDENSNYALSYSDGVELSTYDGTGPNVDFVFNMGAQFNNNGAFCGRVAYTTDAGETWKFSDSWITFGNELAFEGGISECTILEREDGTLVLYARCQSSAVDNFAISYSLDHGVTWLTPGLKSSIYTVNTQPVMFVYELESGVKVPLMTWGGNNIRGGDSYIRNPFNIALSTNGMDAFRNIQNSFAETFMEDYKSSASHYITNASMQQYNGDDLIVTFSRLQAGDSVTMLMKDFSDWFTRTKGAYDSFEHGTVKYEGWSTVAGDARATKDLASEGEWSMLVSGNANITRSIPYLQDGTISIDVYVGENTDFTMELQSAYSLRYGDSATPVGFQVIGNQLTFLGAEGTSGLALEAGWNTLVFDLSLSSAYPSVKLSVNGGKFVKMPVNTEAGDYICYITIGTSDAIYVDELLVIDELNVVTTATEADKAAAEAVIEKIKAIGEVELDDGEAIATARYAYDKLTQTQRDLVDRRVPSGTTDKVNEEGSLINYYEVLVAAEEAYRSIYGESDNTEKLEYLWTLVQKYYDEAYEYAYDYAEHEGYIKDAVYGINTAIHALEKLDLSGIEMTDAFRAELEAEIEEIIETLEEAKILIQTADVLDQESLDALIATLDEAGEAMQQLLVTLTQAGVDVTELAVIPALKAAHKKLVEEIIPEITAKLEAAIKAGTDWLLDKAGEAYDDAVDALIKALPDIDAWLYDWLYNNPEKVIAFFNEYGDEIIEILDANKEAISAVLGYIINTYGDDVAEYVMENPEQALKTMIQWYDTYGYRVWPMIDVYLEALGVYDQIDEAMDQLAELLKQTGIDVVEELEALVNALVEKAEAALEELKEELAELKAQLENASGELAAEIKAKIAQIEAAIEELEEKIEALKETIDKLINEGIGAVEELKAIAEELEAILKELYIDATTDEYAVKSDSWYTAIGDGTAASESYVDHLAEDLNLGERYTNLAEAGQTILDAYDVITANKDTIAKSDLITVGYGVNGFNTFVKNQILSGDTMDWSTITGEESVEYIDAALAELNAYFVEQGLDKDIEIPMIGTKNLADTLTLAVEAYAYAYIEYVTNYPEVINAIHELSPEALVIIVGMYNPLEGVVIEGIDLGEYLGCIVDATNAHSLAYAMLTENVIYVDAPEVETKKTASEMTAEALILEMMTGFKNLVPSENGHEYIETQILNALEITGLLGDANGDGKVNNVDAMLVLQYYAGLAVEINTAVCDVDGNGKINNVDAMLILQYYAQIITVFPVEA